MVERAKLTGLRTVAWYIDGFAVAAIVMLILWILELIGLDINWSTNAAVPVLGFTIGMFLYRLVVEHKWASSLGKYSLRLEVIHARPSLGRVALRNSYLLLGGSSALNIDALAYAGEIVLIIVGLSTLLLGRSLFDSFAGAFVEPVLLNGQRQNPWRKVPKS